MRNFPLLSRIVAGSKHNVHNRQLSVVMLAYCFEFAHTGQCDHKEPDYHYISNTYYLRMPIIQTANGTCWQRDQQVVDNANSLQHDCSLPDEIMLHISVHDSSTWALKEQHHFRPNLGAFDGQSIWYKAEKKYSAVLVVVTVTRYVSWSCCPAENISMLS